jgi:hypothetical protein
MPNWMKQNRKEDNGAPFETRRQTSNRPGRAPMEESKALWIRRRRHAMIAESVLLKTQFLVINRARRRAPILQSSIDCRLACGRLLLIHADSRRMPLSSTLNTPEIVRQSRSMADDVGKGLPTYT